MSRSDAVETRAVKLGCGTVVFPGYPVFPVIVVLVLGLAVTMIGNRGTLKPRIPWVREMRMVGWGKHGGY